MKSNNDRTIERLNPLNLRSVSMEMHQIRYWSALDDPKEEKWDYQTRIPRAGNYATYDDYDTAYDDDDYEEPRRIRRAGPSPAFIALIALLVVALGVGGYFLTTKVILPSVSSASVSGSGNLVQGYMVKLGNRDLGIVVDKAAVESYVETLLQSQSNQMGQSAALSQTLQFTPITVDMLFTATTDDITNKIGYHAQYTYTPLSTPTDDPADAPTGGDDQTTPGDDDADAGQGAAV